MAEPTVGAGYTRALLAHAVARGCDRRTLMGCSGIHAADLEEPEGRVPLAACVALMKGAIDASGDPAFALKFGEAVRTEDLSIALQAAGFAETVESGRRQANRLARLVLDDGGGEPDLLRLVRDRRGVWLQLAGSIYVDNPCFVEAGLAWCVRETRAMLEGMQQAPPFLKALHLAHREPSYRAEYDRIFNVPLVFESDRNAMLIDERFLSLRLPASNPYVARVLVERAEALLQSLAASETTRGHVEGLLTPVLHVGGTNMKAIAGKMGLSRQTLFRRLRAEGVTFQTVLDDLRRRVALHHLSGGKTSVSETAFLAGFSDPAAFSRAFKRWTGASPRSSRPARSSN